MKADPIINAVLSVTKAWAKQRKAEERNAARASNRRRALSRSHRVTLTEIAELEIPTAYMMASANGTLPASARQVFYPFRKLAQKHSDKPLDSKYFTQTLLPAYLREHQDETAEWDVVFDARGHFHEPHTRRIVPLGTLDVRAYLSNESKTSRKKAEPVVPLFDTRGPKNRFGAILFIEKEGFLPLFERVKLAEKYDLGIMSTKGMSVVAARRLADRVCGENRIPLLVLHDFDKSGFSILGTLTRSNDRYRYLNRIKVIDLGLRLKDVIERGLESESVDIRASDDFSENLRRNGATDDEIEFLEDGERVELNAMDAGQLVEWIEEKLVEHGIKKVIPETVVLELAFRQVLHRRHVLARSANIETEAKKVADAAKVPKDLIAKVQAALDEDPAQPWDRAVASIAKECGNE
jgi:hypothetical protein